MKIYEKADKIIEKLSRIPVKRSGLYFLCCSQKLLPLYERFSEETEFGHVVELEKIMDLLWAKFKEKGGFYCVEEYRSIVTENTPHREDFDTVYSVIAQDLCLCLDSALCGISEGMLDLNTANYSWDAVYTAVYYELTGKADMNGDKSRHLKDMLSEDARIIGEFAWQNELIKRISTKGNILDLNGIRDWTRFNAWSVKKLLHEKN